MKPAFALSLSSDGIAVFHRAADGWRSVGETAFDTDDLPQALAALRAEAQRLEPEGVQCKLILPRDQIRYLTVETGDADEAGRMAAARQALEGATPYAVEELAFDICADGPLTHVAAVALETLDEAETFAVEHDFHPVSFVAQPAAALGDGFHGEPFFGTTRAIRGTEVIPDSAPVPVQGADSLPGAAAELVERPETEPDAASGAEPVAKPVVEQVEAPLAETAATADALATGHATGAEGTADPEPQPEQDPALALELSPAMDLEPELDLEQALQEAANPAVTSDRPYADEDSDADNPEDQTSAAPSEPTSSAGPAQASAQASASAPAAGTTLVAPQPDAAPDQPASAEPQRDAPGGSATKVEDRKAAEPAEPSSAETKADSNPDKSKNQTARVTLTATPKTGAPAVAPIAAPAAAPVSAPVATAAPALSGKTPPVIPPAPRAKPLAAALAAGQIPAAFASRRNSTSDAGTAKPAAAVPVPPPAAAGPLLAPGHLAAVKDAKTPNASASAEIGSSAPSVTAPAAASAALPPAPAPLPQRADSAAPAPGSDASNGDTTGPRVGGKPKFLGVILTAVLLLFMATVAVWAVYGTDGFWSAPDAADSPVTSPDSPEDAAPQEGRGPGISPPHSGQAAPETPAIAPQVSVLPDQPDPGVREIIPQPPETAAAPLDVAGRGDGADDAVAPIDTELATVDPSAEDEAAADGVVLPEADAGAVGPDPASPAPDQVQTAGEAGRAQATETAAREAADIRMDAENAALDPLAAAARYAATGVWPSPPELDTAPQSAAMDQLYAASIDQIDLAADAVALPQPDSFQRDLEPAAVASPAAAGGAYELDERGLVKATPDGTLNPDGVMVYLGRPQKVPPPAPARSDPDAEALAAAVARDQVLSRLRPKARPGDLAERIERAQLGGLSREELARVRPKPRPPSLKPANENLLPVTAQAVAASVVPRARPANFANLVDRARRNSQNNASRTTAAVPAAAASVAPGIPTTASVARRATVNGAINLRKVNLIGIYGTPANRRALVRLPSGRYKKVKVGDRIDGGRIIAIGEGQLQYQKGGRNRTLTMPKG